MTHAQLRAIALSFRGVSEGTSYGKPAFLLGKKFFTRLRREDDSVVLIVGSIDERDMLLEADPGTFHITDHYRNYPAVLARMGNLDPETLRAMLERRWRALAPKKLVKQLEGDLLRGTNSDPIGPLPPLRGHLPRARGRKR
ncbi:MAG: MmcQ/YjbR family DNA-binding protein [Rhizomicrobium sp.]